MSAFKQRKTAYRRAATETQPRVREFLLPSAVAEAVGAPSVPYESTPHQSRPSARRTPPKALPITLQLAGNANVWQEVVNHIVRRPHEALMLSGPTGCGKSRGIGLLGAHLHRGVYELNATSTGSSEELGTWLREVGTAKTLLGERLMVVDDIEGLDDRLLSVLLRACTGRVEGMAPLIVVCNDPWIPRLCGFRPLTRYKLWRPRLVSAMEWARHDGCGRSVTDSVLRHHAFCADGDLRQLRMRLRVNLRVSKLDATQDIFTGVRNLLAQKCTLEEWARQTSYQEQLHILSENMESLCATASNDGLEAAASMADAFSFTQCLPDDYRLDIVGRRAQMIWRTDARAGIKLSLSRRPRTTPPRFCDWR